MKRVQLHTNKNFKQRASTGLILRNAAQRSKQFLGVEKWVGIYYFTFRTQAVLQIVMGLSFSCHSRMLLAGISLIQWMDFRSKLFGHEMKKKFSASCEKKLGADEIGKS